jgi:diguanylate cyclase (GGDEF)-like protein
MMNAAFQGELAEAPDRLTLARSLACRGYPARAYAMAIDLHDHALRNADEALLAASADCLADCAYMTAQYEQGIRFARSARALWQARGDEIRQAGAASRLALLLSFIGEPDAVIEAETAIELAERSADRSEIIRALDSTSVVFTMLKQPDRALSFSERAVELSRSCDFPHPVALVDLAEATMQAALLATSTGTAEGLRPAVSAALATTREALDLARARGDGWLERLAINNLAEYSLHSGNTEAAETILKEFDQAAGEATDRCRLHHWWIGGRVLAARGSFAEALGPLNACRRLAVAVNDLETATPCYRDLSDAYANLGEFESALAAYRAYHECYVRLASESAQRRARIYALQREADELRAAATEAELRAASLAASNEFLAREAERLTRTSLEDPLTGLPNRRRLDVAFLDLLTTGAPFALAMIDVDHFKQVNDRFSHPVGDAVLRTIADLLAGGARIDDLVVRYGGEEFALLMRGTDLTIAERACERLRLAVQGHDWGSLRPDLAVTISIGVAASTEDSAHDAIVALADLRLYQAKQRGRNRVVVGP